MDFFYHKCKNHGLLKKDEIYICRSGVTDCKQCAHMRISKYREKFKKNIKERNAKYWKETHLRPDFRKKLKDRGLSERIFLKDSYIKKTLCQNSSLSAIEIPEILITLKRTSILLKRYIKENK